MTAWADAMWLWSWQSLLLIAGAAIVARALRVRSAAHRHTFWLVVFVSTACLPIANAVVTSFPELPRPAATIPIQPFSQPTMQSFPTVETVGDVMAPQAHGKITDDWHWLPPARAAFWAWLAGMALSLGGSLRSYATYRRYRRTASLLKTVECSRDRVPLAYSDDLQVPVLVGFLHPTIMLPTRIAEWMTPEEQQAVVLHEVAHYERRDHWVSLFQVLIRAVLFFHPAVRYAARQLVAERELACDERVLRTGTAPSAYSEAILKVAERFVAQKEIVSPAMHGSARTLDKRLQMIRSYSRVPGKWSVSFYLLRLAAVVLLAILVLPERVLTSQIPTVPALASAFVQQPSATSIPAAPAAVLPEQPPRSVAQSSTLSGFVREPGGRFVSGLEVFLIRDTADTTHSTMTTDRGTYEFVDVAPGKYTLSAPGHNPWWQDIQTPVALEPGAQTLSFQIEGAVAFQVGGGVVPPAPGATQNSDGRLAGKILDQTGGVIPGVNVELRLEGVLVSTTISDSAGAYAFAIRESGQYTLQARLPGFKAYARTLTLRQGETLTQNVLLQLAGTTARIEVIAAKGEISTLPELPARIGGDVAAPNLIYSPRPVYPPRARALHVQGDVVLEAVIGSDGTIVSVQVNPSQGTADLDLIRAAIDSVKQWRYKPAFLNGSPVEFATTITVNFSFLN